MQQQINSVASLDFSRQGGWTIDAIDAINSFKILFLIAEVITYAERVPFVSNIVVQFGQQLHYFQS